MVRRYGGPRHMNSSGKVLIAAPVHFVLTEGLEENGYECIVRERISQREAFDLVKDCTGIVTSTRLQLNRDLIDAAPALAWIGRMGSGMEVVDTAYAALKGIACFSSPEGNSNAVGEHALGMLLSLIRHIPIGHTEVQQGIWRREENRGTELEGKTIGIIGFGHTGRAFARKLSGFDMRILAYDKYNSTGMPEQVVNCRTLDPVFEEADIVSYHVPVQSDTIHYFNEWFINSMRKRFVVINTSRGLVLDTASLLYGLDSGRVAGACLDVYETEPPGAMDSEMRRVMHLIAAKPNVILTPHIAGYTHEALYKMSVALLHKIQQLGAK